MQAYLHFGFGLEPRQTIAVDHKITDRPYKGRTESGYGLAVPTEYMVSYNGRWRRVYACVMGNSPSFYIGKPGAWIAVVDIHN